MGRDQSVESYAWEGWKNMLYPLWDSWFLLCVFEMVFYIIKSVAYVSFKLMLKSFSNQTLYNE